MATIVLAAAGSALGTAAGGSVLGLSMATLGQAAGATLGRIIDQRLLGAGSDAVETGRVDRFRLTTASEGTAIGQLHGRMRVSGHVIWATHFQESSETTGGGKGTSGPAVTEYSYSVSLAVALCEGQISRVGRVWADGVEVAPDTLNMRVYTGTADQVADPKITAVEGADNSPAYRGIAYVVMEDLALGAFGNRVPQFSFEVMRREVSSDIAIADLSTQIEAVALIPGTGEYALATQPAYLEAQVGEVDAINVNTTSGGTDFETALTALSEELPLVKSGLLVVSWFGNDLRCGSCFVEPKVEQGEVDADDMPWAVAGAVRGTAGIIAQDGERPIYGGTPDDASVVQAIQAMKAEGIGPVFYPFILMEQQAGNELPDPYSDGTTQPALPWRGRITTSKAPGVAGTTDQTSTADQEVADFLGTAAVGDFAIEGERVNYSGPSDWRYRRFILHYAHLCAAAGGVDAFCIGSELRGLTQIRGADGFPFVDALRQLAGEVRTVLGPDCKISYAADWSEYHGYQPPGTEDKLFHLDLLWADPEIDFIGIDNYMPLSDWRDGDAHADADWGSIYNLDYLRANVAGGEGFDWFYHSDTARVAQIRTEITDGQGEPWIWRYKDLSNWWSNLHHDRVGGVRQPEATAWQPGSKPFWFTEYGCAAIDKGTNQPNKFLDPKSSESQLPHWSSGQRDDFLQMQYYKAMRAHFAELDNNPMSTVYNGAMVDMSRAHAWAWDMRPFPQFPANTSRWADGDNYTRGHWLNGRASARTLASVVTEVCAQSGVQGIDVSQLYGLVRGYNIADLSTGRAALQPLLLAYGVEAVEREGTLTFFNRDGSVIGTLGPDDLAYDPELGGDVQATRRSDIELSGRVQAGFVDAQGDYNAQVSETVHPEETNFAVSRSEFPLALTLSEGQAMAERWAHEARVAQDNLRFSLPPSVDVSVGDVVRFNNEAAKGIYRLDRIQEDGLRQVEATRVAEAIYAPPMRAETAPVLSPIAGPTPVVLLTLDLPSLNGEDGLKMPFIAASAQPWPGSVAVYGSMQDSGYVLQDILTSRTTMGITTAPLLAGPAARRDRQGAFEVRLISGDVTNVSDAQLLEGANLFAIGDGTATGWEIIQAQYSEPLGERHFRLTGLLRGQGGTVSQGGESWPEGSYLVALNGLSDRLTVPNLTRSTQRHVRHGPAKRPFTDASYRHAVHTFDGVSLRPYPVCHMAAEQVSDGSVHRWIRQTRIGGDVWSEGDVPLGEEAERYTVEVRYGGAVRRRVEVTSPNWTYSTADQISDGTTNGYEFAVAQVSARFGAGPFRLFSVGG